MMADAEKIVHTCEGCQYYARQTHVPAQSTLDDPHHVAICGLGARSSWAPQEGAGGLHTFDCRHGESPMFGVGN
jgi:hypothetical protein